MYNQIKLTKHILRDTLKFKKNEEVRIIKC